MKTMKAAVLAVPLQIEIRQIPIPEMSKGMLMIKVSACGVCGSDIHLWKTGKGWNTEPIDNFHLGHEFCGVVADAGESNFKEGDRVTFWANLYCGKCDMCQQGKEHLCREVHGKNYIGFVCNGGYAEYFIGKASNAYKLPDSVSDAAAALIDPLMVAYHAVKQSSLKLNEKVLVVGSGIIGQLIGEFIDAISGGGGLLTISALLISGIPAHLALGTNKISAFMGTSIALINFARSGLVLWRIVFYGIIFAIMGSWAGYLLALMLDQSLLAKIIIILLPIGMVANFLPSQKNKSEELSLCGWKFWFSLILVCFSTGCYDGFFGPGTGTFFILGFHWILGIDLLKASATTKALNLATNFNAGVNFIINGAASGILALLWPAFL